MDTQKKTYACDVRGFLVMAKPSEDIGLLYVDEVLQLMRIIVPRDSIDLLHGYLVLELMRMLVTVLACMCTEC